MAVRVMPLGDSVTRGVYPGTNNPIYFGGYRGELLLKLRQAGYDVELVGSQHDPILTGHPAGGWGGHEGWGGATIGQTPGAGAPRFLAPGWIATALSTHQPDVVLLNAGINDGVALGWALDTLSWGVTLNHLAQLLTTIQQARPGVRVIVGTTPLIKPEVLWSGYIWTLHYNRLMEARVREARAAGCNVRFAEVYSVVPAASLLDGTHPDAAGHVIAAERWYQALTQPEPEPGPLVLS